MRIILDNKEIAAAPTSDLIGNRRYGDVHFRRKRLVDWQAEVIESALPGAPIFRANTTSELDSLLQDEGSVLVLPMTLWIKDVAAFQSMLQRIAYGGVDCRLASGSQHALFSSSQLTTIKIKSMMSVEHKPDEVLDLDVSRALLDISDYRNCLDLLSGAFEARHFNQLSATTLTLTKRSDRIDKVKAEHDYWYLLPNYMKRWFVMPFNFKEIDGHAQYEMERLSIADLALQWVHGAISPVELNSLLMLIGSYLNERPTRSVTGEKADLNFDEAYNHKVRRRQAELKKMPIWQNLNAWVSAGTKYPSMDSLYEKYYSLLGAANRQDIGGSIEAIGHGDLCFSNILYERHGRVLKLVDTRGALTETQMWMDPTYDIIKLSHSLMGDYDFINSGLFRLQVNRANSLQLEIFALEKQVKASKKVFCQWLQANGYNYRLVRLLESSLFLSMLPLHADHPNKVLGFVINAVDILEEIDT